MKGLNVLVLALLPILFCRGEAFAQQSVSRAGGLAGHLNRTKVDTVEFQKATLDSALQYLSARAGGIPFVVLDTPDRAGIGGKEVTLSLRGVSAATVLKYLCELSGSAYFVETTAVVVGSPADLQTLKKLRQSNPAPVANGRAMTMLKNTALAGISLNDVSVTSALQLLRNKTAESHRGQAVNFVLLEDLSGSQRGSVAEQSFTLDLGEANVRASTLLRYFTELCGLGLRVKANAVLIGSPQRINHQTPNRVSSKSALFQFLRSKPVEKISFTDIAVADAVEAVRHFSRPAGSGSGGLNVIDAVKGAAAEVRFDLELNSVSLWELVEHITTLSGTRVKAEGMTLVFEADPGVKHGAATDVPDQGNDETGGAADAGLRFDR